MGVTCSANRHCWRAGWSRSGARFVTVAWDAPTDIAGIRTFTVTTCASICCPGSIRPRHSGRRSRRAQACSMKRWSSAWARWGAPAAATATGGAGIGALVSCGAGRRRHSRRHRLRAIGQGRRHSAAAPDQPRRPGLHGLSRPGHRSRDARRTTRRVAPRQLSMAAGRWSNCWVAVLGAYDGFRPECRNKYRAETGLRRGLSTCQRLTVLRP